MSNRFRRKPRSHWWHLYRDYPTATIRLCAYGEPRPLERTPCSQEQSMSADTPEDLAYRLAKRIQVCARRGYYVVNWLELDVGYAKFGLKYTGVATHISLNVVHLRSRSPREHERRMRATLSRLRGRWSIVAVVYDSPCRSVAIVRRLPIFDFGVLDPAPPPPSPSIEHDDTPAPPDPLANVPRETIAAVERMLDDGCKLWDICSATDTELDILYPIMLRRAQRGAA